MSFTNRNIEDLSYECEGFTYEPWEEREEDNIKIWHDMITPTGDILHGPWSPYEVPTLEQFCDFVNKVMSGKWNDGLFITFKKDFDSKYTNQGVEKDPV